jgi:hypothetical protein
VEFSQAVCSLVKAMWIATGYCCPAVVDAGPAPVELPLIVDPGGSGAPLVGGQFLKKRPFEGWAPEHRVARVGAWRYATMLATLRFPLFASEIFQVPVPRERVTLSEIIWMPSTEAPLEVLVVPPAGLLDLEVVR